MSGVTRTAVPNGTLNQEYARLKLQVEGFAQTVPSVAEISVVKQNLEITLQKIKELTSKNPMSGMAFALALKNIPNLIKRCDECLPKDEVLRLQTGDADHPGRHPLQF